MESANRTETEGNGGEGEGKWKKEMDQIEEMRMKYWGIDFDWLNCRRNRARESRIKNAATAEQKKNWRVRCRSERNGRERRGRSFGSPVLVKLENGRGNLVRP